MKKSLKVILIVLITIFILILLDMFQAIIFKKSSIIHIRNNELQDKDSYVDKGILVDTYYCIDYDVIYVKNVSKFSKYTCPIKDDYYKENEYVKMKDVEFIPKDSKTAYMNCVDTTELIKYNGTLYGQYCGLIEIASPLKLEGKIDKLIDSEYVPKLDGETNAEKYLNTSVYDVSNESLILAYTNDFRLFVKVEIEN